MGEYRIQTFSALTGVSPDRLRAWERRYGIPAPARDPSSSYRVYNDRDVTLVRELRALTDAGVPPSEAAQRLNAQVLESGPPPVERDAFDLVRERTLTAITDFDPDTLDTELRRALILGSAAEVFDRVLVPVMVAVGERWGAGDLSVAHEHLASEALRAVAGDLLRLVQPSRASVRAWRSSLGGERRARCVGSCILNPPCRPPPASS